MSWVQRFLHNLQEGSMQYWSRHRQVRTRHASSDAIGGNCDIHRPVRSPELCRGPCRWCCRRTREGIH
eukprot:scaffold94905_cov36-Cyclotella_meneghiniana.AAC.16